MESSDLLTIGEIVERSGFPHSALRYYEREGLISASRTSGGQRRSGGQGGGSGRQGGSRGGSVVAFSSSSSGRNR